MATRKKARARRRVRSRNDAVRTMNQFATIARKRVRSLQREAESVSGDVGAWIGEKAVFVRDTVKKQPVLMAVLASVVGAVGWAIGRRT